jgi:hypothetical protein
MSTAFFVGGDSGGLLNVTTQNIINGSILSGNIDLRSAKLQFEVQGEMLSDVVSEKRRCLLTP